MAKQKITGLSASLLSQPMPVPAVFSQPEPVPARPVETVAAATPPPGRPVVQTVKVPPDVYIRLKTVGAQARRSSQDIILAALREYLNRFPAAS
jgi:hypothetical protein